MSEQTIYSGVGGRDIGSTTFTKRETAENNKNCTKRALFLKLSFLPLDIPTLTNFTLSSSMSF